jgi:hypothetical protein
VAAFWAQIGWRKRTLNRASPLFAERLPTRQNPSLGETVPGLRGRSRRRTALAQIADFSWTSREARKVPEAEVAALLDHLVVTGEHLAATVIRAARLAAILLRIARGLRRAYKGLAHL